MIMSSNGIIVPPPGYLEALFSRVRAAGGTVLSEPISIPAGRFAYTRDPDGNSIGLFEGR